MKTHQFDIKTPDGKCDTFAVYPSGETNFPAVILLMDAYGPRPYLYEMAEKMASAGYYVLVPNLFYRIRRAPVVDVKFPLTLERLPEAREQLMSLFNQYDPDAALRDVDAFLNFLSQQKQVRPGPVGVTGYCMGGNLALRAAAQYPDQIAAAASFHGGRLASDAPNSPHRFVASIKAKVYVAHADADASMPPDQIERLNQALQTAGVNFEAEVYPGAPHGFTMADLPAYNKAALDRHWKKLLPLFHETLVQ